MSKANIIQVHKSLLQLTEVGLEGLDIYHVELSNGTLSMLYSK